ncbi:MAG: ABC transporter substrate-binding protein [Rectinemataceae bacterium]|nr:ABC transporter substrate-binding protein [Rectinemataceae bacterium]
MAFLLSASAFAAPTPKNGGILKVGAHTNPKILGYPAEVTNNGPLPYLDPILQALTRFSEKGDTVPWLAESFSTDAVAKTVTFILRNGIKFQDGTTFDADAVKWNIEQYVAAKRNETAAIIEIKVIDPKTVRITLKDWNSGFLPLFGYYIRFISPTAFKANGKEWCYSHPVGTGPFMLDKWEMNVSVAYKRNPNYWEKGLPLLDGIQMFIMEDPMTISSALRAGEIDIWREVNNIDIADELIKSGEFNIVLHKNGIGAVGTGLIPDCTTPGSPWKDVKVRKAMCYAIDEKMLAKTFGKGYYVTTNQWGSPEAITFNKDVVGYPYNPEKAKQLLKEAGLPNGFKTKLFSPIGSKDMFTAIQSYLAAVGINAELIIVDEPKNQSLYFSTWEGGLMGHYHSVQPDLGSYMFRHLDPNGAFYAKGILHPDDVVALLKQNQQAPNDKIKIDTSMKLQKLVYDEYCLVGKPLFIPMFIYIKNTKVHDDGSGLTHGSYWTPGNAWIDR